MIKKMRNQKEIPIQKPEVGKTKLTIRYSYLKTYRKMSVYLGSLNGILHQASNELNILSAQKLSQTGSQMMLNPHVHSSVAQSQVSIGTNSKICRLLFDIEVWNFLLFNDK